MCDDELHLYMNISCCSPSLSQYCTTLENIKAGEERVDRFV